MVDLIVVAGSGGTLVVMVVEVVEEKLHKSIYYMLRYVCLKEVSKESFCEPQMLGSFINIPNDRMKPYLVNDTLMLLTLICKCIHIEDYVTVAGILCQEFEIWEIPILNMIGFHCLNIFYQCTFGEVVKCINLAPYIADQYLSCNTA